MNSGKDAFWVICQRFADVGREPIQALLCLVPGELASRSVVLNILICPEGLNCLLTSLSLIKLSQFQISCLEIKIEKQLFQWKFKYQVLAQDDLLLSWVCNLKTSPSEASQATLAKEQNVTQASIHLLR